ncbi:TetR/AcrR family transcriptional regulator [Nocardioides sp. J54]|uniref:TetR/AcrR family transcriptional regulator n=1 Tax=Nocardioides sp. J54 TaxID=935866 RepID=UPI0004ACD225|nr:TetR/AcrR family transcriptional regulator [Nocardioides sp. J54]
MSSQDAIITAARELFTAHPYHAVTIRDIAARAGTSAALVMKLGGSKVELFRRSATIAPPPLPDVPVERLGWALVDEVVARREQDTVEHLVRAANLKLTGPDPEQVRTLFLAGYVEPMVAVLDGPDAGLRAELVVAALGGLAATLRLFETPASVADLDGVRERYGRVVQQLLDG